MKISIARILWGVNHSRIPKDEIELIKFHSDLVNQQRAERNLNPKDRSWME